MCVDCSCKYYIDDDEDTIKCAIFKYVSSCRGCDPSEFTEKDVRIKSVYTNEVNDDKARNI